MSECVSTFLLTNPHAGKHPAGLKGVAVAVETVAGGGISEPQRTENLFAGQPQMGAWPFFCSFLGQGKKGPKQLIGLVAFLFPCTGPVPACPAGRFPKQR